MSTTAWKRTTLGSVARLRAGSTPSRKRLEYFATGSIPWVKTGDLTNGFILTTDERVTPQAVDDCSLLINPPDTVLIAMYGGFNQIGRTGLLTMDAATNQAIMAVRCDPAQLSPRFLLTVLNARITHWRSVASSSRKDPNITRSDIESFPLPLPSLHKQQQIATIAEDFEAEQRTIVALVAAKQGLVREVTQQLLTGQRRYGPFDSQGHTRSTPFGDIPPDWDYPEIQSIAHQMSVRAGPDCQSPVLACSKYDGLVESLSYFGRRIFSADTSNYKVVRRGQFAFPTNHIEEGSIGLLRDHPEGLVSPIYVVFEPTDRVVPEFLYAVFKSETYRHIFAAATNSSVNRRGSLRWAEFGKLRVPLPSTEEQQRIAETLLALTRDVDGLGRLAVLLDKQKRAVLGRLLSGELELP